jgi:hypothetical protein
MYRVEMSWSSQLQTSVIQNPLRLLPEQYEIDRALPNMDYSAWGIHKTSFVWQHLG